MASKYENTMQIKQDAKRILLDQIAVWIEEVEIQMIITEQKKESGKEIPNELTQTYTDCIHIYSELAEAIQKA